MRVSIDVLRQAVKSVLPLASESFKGKGTGCFVALENSTWLVTGSFGHRFAGARVCDETDESVINNWFSVSDLFQFVGATFSSDFADITYSSSRIQVKIGRNKRTFPYIPSSDMAGFIDLPPLSSGMTISDMSLFQTIASASHTDVANNLHGVYMMADEYLEMISTDGFLIAYGKLKNDLLQKFVALVPADFLSYVGRVYWNTKPRMSVTANKVYFVSDDLFAIGALGHHDLYPGRKVAEFYANIEFGSEAVVDALDFSDKISALTGVDLRVAPGFINVSAVHFEFDDERGDLHLRAESQDNGDAEFFVSSHGLNYRCVLNGHLAKKAAQLLRSVNSKDLLFSPADGQNLMLVRPSDSDSLIVGIVPMSH